MKTSSSIRQATPQAQPTDSQLDGAVAHAQHTPETWHYQALAGHHEYAVYNEATGRDVALVRDFDEDRARLISAAPDLLELAQAFLSYLLDDSQSPRRRHACLEAARDALSKALG